MTKEITIEDNKLILDSDRIFTGYDVLDDFEKNVRKAVGLPIKKQLIYYIDKREVKSKVNVKSFRLIELYDTWYTVEIILENNDRVTIHSSYFAEMQKASFVSDMKEQMGKG